MLGHFIAIFFACWGNPVKLYDMFVVLGSSWASKLPINHRSQRSMSSMGLLALFGCTCALVGASVVVMTWGNAVTLMIMLAVALLGFASGWTARGKTVPPTTTSVSLPPSTSTNLWTDTKLHLRNRCHTHALKIHLVVTNYDDVGTDHVCKHCINEM